MALNLENPDDVKRELDNLQRILTDPTERESLLELKGDEAQRELDMLQLVMFRLSKNSGRAPRCLIIQNIKRCGDRAFGGGGFGDVWKGEIGESGSDRIECAIKVARWYRSLDGEEGYKATVKTHVREAILWRQLKHPNLLPFLGMYYLDDSMKDICLVSPFIANGNLYQFLKSTRPEEVDGHTLMFDIASGIEYLHDEDIVHGDLKELNILVREGFRACICDFGLSRLTMTHGLGPTLSCWAGTPGPYTAPEILLGRLSTKETDVYAFGTLCYGILRELYSLSDSDITAERGQTPPPPRPSSLPEDEDHVWLLLHECWRQEPSARPTAADIILRILPEDVQVAAAPHWDESLYTTVRNNVDFHPLYASMVTSQSLSDAGQVILASSAVDDFDRVSYPEGAKRPKAETNNHIREGDNLSSKSWRKHTHKELKKPPYAVCHCVNLPHAQSFAPQIFRFIVRDIDLKCTIRAIVLCKRTDGFQHETLIPIISLPGEPAEALAFLERAGPWPGWSFQASLHNSVESSALLLPLPDPVQAQTPHRDTISRDIITLLPKSSVYWRYHKSPEHSYPPFHKLPRIIKNSSTSSPSPDTFVEDSQSIRSKGSARRFVKGLRRQRGSSEVQLSPNSEADHAFIYAIVFSETDPNPPTVLDLTIVMNVVSDYRPDFDLVQHNCFFFAAAICKVMKRQFGGKKVRNGEFHELPPPPFDADSPPCSVELKAAGLRPLQILREDGARFNTMVDALVSEFEEKRKAHPTIVRRDKLGQVNAEQRELDTKQRRIDESGEIRRDMTELQRQQLGSCAS
ncbi:hypothetical protein V5O48_016616, partial [Marasmius crinis-equi]